MKKIYSLMIIAAGILWGTLGVFGKILAGYGFNSAQCAAMRLTSAAVILTAVNIKNLKVNPNQLWKFALLGLFGMFGMTFVYFEAIKRTSISVAAVLLYTAPIMVTVMSAVIYHERLTGRKITALLAAFLGIVLVSGFNAAGATPIGIALGLLSGFFYALYSIIGKYALKDNRAETATNYAFIFSAPVALAACNPASLLATAASAPNKPVVILTMAALGIVTSVIPFSLYTKALVHVPAGKASIMASVEPLAATLFGIALYGEKLTFMSVLGMAAILLAVALLGTSEQ